MRLILLKAKLHQACVTHADLEYDGSCAIDGDLLDLSQIREYEQIQIYNISNGERLTTYAIRAEHGSHIISMNGAAAHKAQPGHRIIICAYAEFTEEERLQHKPTCLYLDQNNHIRRVSHVIHNEKA